MKGVVLASLVFVALARSDHDNYDDGEDKAVVSPPTPLRSDIEPLADEEYGALPLSPDKWSLYPRPRISLPLPTQSLALTRLSVCYGLAS